MEKYFSVNNLGCAHCGAKIEEAISKLECVESAVLNFPMRKIKICGDLTDTFLATINKIANSIEAGVTFSPIEKAHEHHEHHHHDGECDCGHDHEHEHSGDGHCEKIFTVNDLGCAHCGSKIEEAIQQLEYVDSAVLNFPMRKLKIHGELPENFLETINSIANSFEAGVTFSPAENAHKHEKHEQHHHDSECSCGHDHEHEHQSSESSRSHTHSHEKGGLKHEIIPLICGIAFFAAAVICEKTADIKILNLVLFAAAYLILGSNVLLSTLKNIKAKNFFDENFLMTAATIGAFALGEYAEAVGVVLFFRIGELFEDYAVERSRKAITDVAGLKVEEADVLRNGEFVRIDSDEIEVGDILRIKAGERIAADGIVESGESRIDTSAVNGEPVPVTVRKGDEVMSGCINLSETFTLRATAAAADSMISKIAQAVEDASATKPKIDRFITRFAKVYTPIVIAIALATAIIPSLITGNWSKWIYSALTFLVISCPCALVLSVPLAYFSGIGAASKLGILFKGGNAIEALGKIKAIAFDKTGTLTNGSFTVTDIKTYANISENELLAICGSCEQSSTHPVAESITDYCRSKDITLTEPESASEIAGRGISASVHGRNILCGNERLMNENSIPVPDEKTALGSVVYVAVDGKIAGRIIVSDTVKKSSASAISQLKAMGVKTVMLTGDKSENASVMAQQLGIDSVKGDLLPDGKLAEIERIRKESGAVMFVGDGFNDGPVLAGADVGGAMQSGSDLALEASDAVFMNSEPEAVVKAKRIADKTLRISYENIIFALAIKAVVLVLGLIGHPNMWLAVFADSGTAMLLIFNSIRILNTKKYR
ncbi:MAG: cadmium-translocating P-type ATPase [Ruminococcus sp.]|uniref:heavy metal translocating P-type ATPase n=1 Tax=Ruminococcus sp. TaxID=41978 RepID=UPI0025E90074|nr:heavy metal translocating P-type ATPase [Ruminococcus sp.]MCR5599921.1 cadmium-translocating P-type ATPase [Ruminococcus sp.]